MGLSLGSGVHPKNFEKFNNKLFVSQIKFLNNKQQ